MGTSQVIEHVANVHSFLSSCLELTKPGGFLFISAPDNDGFVGAQNDLPLNLPPHHIGRWSRKSLEALTQHFNIELVRIEHEPLQEQNFDWYRAWFESTYLPSENMVPSRLCRLLEDIF